MQSVKDIVVIIILKIIKSYSNYKLKNKYLIIKINTDYQKQIQIIKNIIIRFSISYFTSKFLYDFFIIISEKRMSLNLWNIKSSKQRIGIRERTQAHKKHLMSLVNIRSVIDDKFVKNNKIWESHLKNYPNLLSSRNSKLNAIKDNSIASNIQSANKNKNVARVKSFKGDLIQSRRIEKENQGLVNRIANIQNLKRSKTQGVQKFINLSNSILKNSFSQRVIRQKKIQFENCKMFDRLVSTAPTINRTQWSKGVKDSIKYKKNLQNCKYAKPDYTIQVARQIEKNRGTMKHLQISRLQSYPYSYGNLPGIKSKLR